MALLLLFSNLESAGVNILFVKRYPLVSIYTSLYICIAIHPLKAALHCSWMYRANPDFIQQQEQIAAVTRN